MTNERGADPGWYADPMGRYEHRYFNGRAWTSDVSIDGVRWLDPLGLTPTRSGPSEQGSGRHAAATTSMVLGIVAISIAWMPFLVVIGAIAGALAIGFAVAGLRRARSSGAGRSFAVVGLATGASAVLASVIGVLLTMIVLRAYDEYLNPPPSEVAVTSCALEGTRAVMTGTLENTGDRDGDYSVLIGFVRPGTDNTHRTERVRLDDIAAGAVADFDAQSQVDLDDVDCVIVDVTGPLPFGISID